MTNDEHEGPTHLAWARFRFSVVGPLLSCPPPRGELRTAIETLAEKSWKHPVSGDWVMLRCVPHCGGRRVPLHVPLQ